MYNLSDLITLNQGLAIGERVLEEANKKVDNLTAEDIKYNDETVADALDKAGLDFQIATDEEVQEALDDVFGDDDDENDPDDGDGDDGDGGN